MENNRFGRHESVFLADTKETDYPKLEQDIRADLVIIGGGIVGITLAYLLKNSGQKVVLIEADRIATGMTPKSTAKLTLQHSLIYDELMHTKSPGKAKEYADANLRAIEFVKQTVKEEQIHCDLIDMPSYVYTIEDKNINRIKNEVEACKRLGIDMIYKESLPLNLPIKAAMEWEGACLFHPRKYLLQLAEEFIKSGGKIYEDTAVTLVTPTEDMNLETANGCHIYAQRIVITSHFPMYDGLGLYFSRLNMKRLYVVGAEVDNDKIPKGSFISIDMPKYSIRPVYEKGLVLIGGAEHRTGDDENESVHFEELSRFAKQVFDSDKILYHWSTQDYVTSDKMPYIGYLNSSLFHNVYVATGFNKWGMTGGTNAALVLRDMLLTGKSTYEELFNPKRSGVFSGSTFAMHNMTGIKNYLQGKLRSIPREKFPDKEEATVTKLEDGNVYGIYQDAEEVYHIVHITCPHVGANLRWNSAEKSWDCPFHGSRFSMDGDILEGPSTHRLNSYKEEKNQIHPNLY